MSNDTPRRRGSRSQRLGRRKHGLALVVASVAGLALAAPVSAQLGAVQSQSGSNGTLQAVVTNVQVTETTVQAPVNVNARELEILELVSRGFESPEIARELHLSPETVRTHVTHVLGKLEARTRAEAVAIAVRGGLIE